MTPIKVFTWKQRRCSWLQESNVPQTNKSMVESLRESCLLKKSSNTDKILLEQVVVGDLLQNIYLFWKDYVLMVTLRET